MKTKNLLVLLAVAGMMVFASCKKDETTTTLTKEEATAAITTVNGDYATSMNELNALPGIEAIDALSNLDLPAPMKVPTREELVKNGTLKAYRTSTNTKGDNFFPFEDFDFNYYKGTWHYEGYYWTKSSDLPADKAVFVFNFKGGTNNATITYSGYTEKTATIMGTSTTFMSQLSAKIEITGRTDNPVVSWNYTATGSGTSTSFTATMNYEYIVGAYSRTNSLSMSLSGTQTTGKFSASWLDEIKKGSDILTSFSFTISLTGNGTSFNESVAANFRVKNMVIKYAFTIDEKTNTEGDPSLYMKISVWTADGAKVADVVFHYIGNDYVPYFKFADNSEVAVSDKLSGDLYDQIDNFMSTIFNFL